MAFRVRLPRERERREEEHRADETSRGDGREELPHPEVIDRHEGEQCEAAEPDAHPGAGEDER